ncbi:MAG: hypothetical protein JXB39_05780 [Deltaproteobacteria bacterium]|nr:hypothetical protein [Deltaproteobacteria bacterium]
MSELASSAGTRSAIAHVLLYLLLAVPLSVLVFLASAGAFQAWEGTATCFYPSRDDRSSRERSFLIVREGAPDTRVRLPTVALASRDLPACSGGLPSLTRPEGAVRVEKRRFRLFVEVDGRLWPTPRPDHLLLTLGCLVLGFPLWNLATVGAPFRVTRRTEPEVPIPVEEIEVPGVRQRPSGQVVPPKDRGSVGPPPSGRRARRRKA